MRPFTHTIPLDEARAIVDRTIVPIARRERVALAEAHGRVCAAGVVSALDVPPFARAAMDGYAVVAADTAGASREHPRTLRIAGRVYTGEAIDERVEPGLAVEIATGAPVPAGADAVVMVEEAEAHGDEVRIVVPARPGQHIGPRGGDITAGQTVLAAGDLLNPSRVGVLAALGLAAVDVWARPRVAILSTGNELVAPGAVLGPGQIHDINRFTLSAVVAEHGGEPVGFATAADTHEALDEALARCLACDLVVFSGGSSVGERDLMLDAVRRAGEVLVHGIAIKPGKPTAFGLAGGTPIFGMPGNPTSCLTNAYILLVPALRRIARLAPYRMRTVSMPLGRRIVSAVGRHQIFTVRIVEGQAMPAFKSSGDITSMSQADGYIEIPAQTDGIDPGVVVDVTLF